MDAGKPTPAAKLAAVWRTTLRAHSSPYLKTACLCGNLGMLVGAPWDTLGRTTAALTQPWSPAVALIHFARRFDRLC